MSRDPQLARPHRTPFHDAKGETVLRRIESHWQVVRGTQTVPYRSDLTTNAMSDEISHSFTLERVTPSVARFRVAGQALHSHLKMEPRGMPISAMFTPQGRQMLAPLIYDVCENLAIVEVSLMTPRRFAKSTLRARLLMMPVRTGDADINTIFGALVVDGKSGGRTLRFDFDPEGTLRTEHLRAPQIRTVHEVAAPVPVTPSSHETPMPRPAAHAARLRLVVDNS